MHLFTLYLILGNCWACFEHNNIDNVNWLSKDMSTIQESETAEKDAIYSIPTFHDANETFCNWVGNKLL